MTLKPSLTNIAQTSLRQVIKEGDTVIDATVGNGHDTCFLAEQVGQTGRVIGFDVQLTALENTEERLKECNHHNVQLILDSHAYLHHHIPTHQKIRAAMMNLGYLPGSDKTRTTEASSTICALGQIIERLEADGIISIIAYTGHTGGRLETETIKTWVANLDPQQFSVSITIPDKCLKQPPELILIHKVI